MRFIAAIGFVLSATSLLCWLFTSPYWIFDPVTGLAIFTVGIVLIGFFGFLSIEDRSNGV